ncbi:DeoR/GlpR family DNA-binding transcription regulator [Streptococcus sp. DD13]|uniref:DeoR/GlpR family DNA-binding transcription regulator n=1 Tax=Streptococcus sp. DD13 TaxID=1777881 RepID=UPI00079C9CB4|nr:DeoR/GlpR family DNA-binding transcription regulator [Streptococcus sp. DD13]KXT78910.1 Transcriptional regulator of rhamnose utilization, DeoR family [Streptococcus sp. DD13]
MTRQDRREEIIALVKKKKRIPIRDLEKMTFLSTSTLRRDLIYLEEQGLLKRRHGEVLLQSLTSTDLSYHLRENTYKKEKKYIASIAKDFIGPGLSLYLDSSTTVFELCPYICKIENLIVFTNGLSIAEYLSDNAHPSSKIFLTGGQIKPHSATVLTPTGDSSFWDQFKIDLAFSSARGIDCHFVYEASMRLGLSKKDMLARSKDVILLLDHSKFYQTAYFKLDPLENYRTIISDQYPDDPLWTSVEELGIEWLA